jgi:hypothetical protein
MQQLKPAGAKPASARPASARPASARPASAKPGAKPGSKSSAVVSGWARQSWELGREDPRGIRGGLFVDREQALRFVRAENGNHPQEFVMVGGVLELDMSKASATTQPGHGGAERRAA